MLIKCLQISTSACQIMAAVTRFVSTRGEVTNAAVARASKCPLTITHAQVGMTYDRGGIWREIHLYRYRLNRQRKRD